MTIGMTGDMLRGATPIGLDFALPFCQQAMYEAIKANPDATSFRVYVNPFGRYIAQKIAKDVKVKQEFVILTDERYAKDSWRIEPDEVEG